MSSTLTANLPMTVSRPKIHRPPNVIARKINKKQRLPGFLLFWAAVLLVLILVSFTINKGPVIKEATTLPAVAVVSERLKPSAAQVDPAMLPGDSSLLLSAPIGDAQADTSNGLLQKPGATILLQDQSSVIVGQMAHIPLEDEQITEVKPINDVDNGSGRELLSIVGKY